MSPSDPLEAFQRYLLWRMQSPKKDALLRSLDLSAERLASEAERFGNEVGLETMGHFASIYLQILGAPESERVIRPDETSENFRDSKQLRWTLPWWPRVDWVVHVHPQGWSWNEGFQAKANARPPEDWSQLEPWSWTKDVLAFARHDVLDQWSYDLDARVFVRALDADGEGEHEEPYLAHFDWDLLQRWERERERE